MSAGCWIAYHHDNSLIVGAVFDQEIEALRFAVDEGYGYTHVAFVEWGQPVREAIAGRMTGKG